jgi:dipeptidase E
LFAKVYGFALHLSKTNSMRFLLLSNSTMPGEPFLDWPAKHIQSFLGSKPLNAVFIPYAAVTFSFDKYESIVKDRFQNWGHSLTSVHRFVNPVEGIQNADVIITGGGNSFHLIKLLQDNNLLDIIKRKVESGTPYIGWSAGSNIACPTICTTNDMPIVQPDNFKALGIVPFQINPHYHNLVVPGHGGETRDERLAEFLTANPTKKVLGLPEGTLLKFENDLLCLEGSKNARLMCFEKPAVEFQPGSDLSFLMH